MKLEQAQKIAEETLEQLRPHCIRCEIAGSIRRKKPEVHDIEIVAIPKPYESLGMFETGIATVVNRWEKLKGELPCKYTARRLPSGIDLDLFFADAFNWGWIYAIRTGPAEFSHRILAIGLNRRGLTSKDGYVQDTDGNHIQVKEEEDLFNLIGQSFVEPEERI